MRTPRQILEPLPARWSRRAAAITAAGLLLFGAPGARGDDPLDDTDGTEDWDQVAPASHQPAQSADQDDFRQEISAWQAVSQQWEQARLQYIEERTRHKRIAAMPRVLPRAEQRPVGYQPDADINDDNYNSATGDDGDWGAPLGSTQVAPSGALDRAIDSELEESGARDQPAPAAQPADEAQPAGPAAGAGEDDRAEPPAAKPDPRAAELARRREAEARAKADREAKLAAEAAEKARVAEEEALRKQAEEDAKRKIAEEEARRDREAAEGAAAAARFLQEQAERERKEAEALRKKAALEEDEEGQVVDPEIKKELGEEDEEEKPEED
ncbi:MAG TPA: hypothetical protein PK668_14550 [Myxococcota bacterium]|nr:hypothetical protein [Myxococcota bacterium]HRY93916.1 hypothetical protein [Myxococcota bacterium]